MNIKCGKEEFELTDKDVIFFNVACYQLITRKVRKGWNQHTPMLAKKKVEKLIKNGELKEIQLDNPPYRGEGYKYYSIKGAK